MKKDPLISIDIQELKISFSDTTGKRLPILNRIDLFVREKEIVALVGESGSGKTVTALSILQLLEKNTSAQISGRIFFQNKNILNASIKEMESIRGNQISMIFQEPLTALNPLFTIGYQITEAITTHENISTKNARARTIQLLQDVGFPDASVRFSDYPHQLSGGQRQRVMIAMALACNPSVLIADEPTTALDVTIQAQILRLLKELQLQRNLSILYITHDLSLISQLAHRVYVMYSGIIVETGSPSILFKNPYHPYTMGLLASLPSFEKRGIPLYNIPGDVPTPLDRPNGCPFYPRCEYHISSCEIQLPKMIDYGNGHMARCSVLFERKKSSHDK